MLPRQCGESRQSQNAFRAIIGPRHKSAQGLPQLIRRPFQ